MTDTQSRNKSDLLWTGKQVTANSITKERPRFHDAVSTSQRPDLISLFTTSPLLFLLSFKGKRAIASAGHCKVSLCLPPSSSRIDFFVCFTELNCTHLQLLPPSALWRSLAVGVGDHNSCSLRCIVRPVIFRHWEEHCKSCVCSGQATISGFVSPLALGYVILRFSKEYSDRFGEYKRPMCILHCKLCRIPATLTICFRSLVFLTWTVTVSE